MSPRFGRGQRGLALLTAMLILAIVVSVGVFLNFGQQLWIRQVQNLADRSEIDSMRHATLDWVSVLLVRDAKSAKPTDNLNEAWAQQLPPLPFEGGSVAIKIEDAQGRFNLNNVVGADGNPNTAHIAVFRQLLQLAGLDPTLTEALVDWIDPNSQTQPNGAEDTEYLAGQHPYRAANRPLASIDELRLVKGFNVEAVEKLRPYVVALPEPTSINANTASNVVLASLFPGMTPEIAQQMVLARTGTPYNSVGDVLQHVPPQFQPKTPPASPPAQPPAAGGQPPVVASVPTFDVRTSYFLVQLEISYGRNHRSSVALIRRPDAKSARVLWHHPQYPRLRPDDETPDGNSN